MDVQRSTRRQSGEEKDEEEKEKEEKILEIVFRLMKAWGNLIGSIDRLAQAGGRGAVFLNLNLAKTGKNRPRGSF